MTEKARGLQISCIDLFAGIGGIRKGFEQANSNGTTETVFVSEYDKYAATTYAANFSTPVNTIEGLNELLMPVDGAIIYGDLTKVPDEALRAIPKFDICLAGFPCQAFSLAGKRLGFDDDYKGMSRGTLFRELIRICEINKPKVVFCENVKGLLHHDGGKTLEVIRGAFDQIGYTMFYDVLSSSNFGVPQTRERLYMVVFKDELAPENFGFPKGESTSLRIKDILEENPVGSRYYLSEKYLNTLIEHKRRHKAKGNGFGYQVRSHDEYAGTLTCGGMGRERNLIEDSRPHSLVPTTGIHGPINSKNIRKMTPREWARLQGFKNSFVLPVADTHLYKQFGNTVTVNVVEAIACQILEYLDDLFKSKEMYELRKSRVLSLLDKEGPQTSSRIANELEWLFLSSYDEAEIKKTVRAALQSLKREGKIAVVGNTRAAVWEIKH
ncbi:DNA (cytosine-5-)-methyltransferase [Raoultibacter timonensis]|uniref:DNA (cytosine-5-)-methyltransferase n=1 Tax=Raoultibacter timonensis TaxID=1907662 RepID=UPI0026DACACE|nr:DNA (cytosine-5-)-methyltransferase [Raoultibacter timonensis]